MSANATTIETNADISAGLAQLKLACPILAQIAGEVSEVPLRRTLPGFASLAEIIVSQQVSKQSADAITARMRKIICPLTPTNYLAAGEAAWVEIGLSRPKQRTFLALCTALEKCQLELDALSEQSADEAMAQLTAIKGIGPWTAEVYLLFAVGHRDIFPAGDLALQQAIADAYKLDDRPDEKQARQKAESWAPNRGVAARLLWAYYSLGKGRNAMP